MSKRMSSRARAHRCSVCENGHEYHSLARKSNDRFDEIVCRHCGLESCYWSENRCPRSEKRLGAIFAAWVNAHPVPSGIEVAF
jgi:hypothetical protein